MREQSVITAYHEAGHAVMAMANGFVVTAMTNTPTDSAMGYMGWLCPDTLTAELHARVILVLTAGMAADVIHWGKHGDNVDELCAGHQGDRRKAADHLAQRGEEGCFDLYLGIAMKFLERPEVWRFVEFFAQLMEGGGTVNGRDLLDRAAQVVPKFGSDEFSSLELLLDYAKVSPDIKNILN